MGCSTATELIAPAVNFGLGLYNADTYYSKECAWYEEVKFNQASKDILREHPELTADLAKVARNNDIYKEVCDE